MSGNKKKLLLDAKNIKTGKIEYSNIAIPEIALKLGVTYSRIINCLYMDKPVKGIYKLIRKGYDISLNKQIEPRQPKPDKIKPVVLPEDLKSEWAEVCNNARLIKLGKARIEPVYKRGIRRYHTVILDTESRKG